MANPELWGPGLWKYLHALPEHSESISSLRATLSNLDLPCPDCRAHYKNYITSHSIDNIKTRKIGQRWIFDLHNSVNKRLGKPEYSFEACVNDCERIKFDDKGGIQPRLFY